jgi:ankyrin repeat protein
VGRLGQLIDCIVARDGAGARALVKAHPEVAGERVVVGATRAEPRFVAAIGHHLYAGDTALHVAAAAHDAATANALLAAGADVAAQNRRGAQAIHYAADGTPEADDEAQAAVIAVLAKAGADVDACNKDGTAPLHRAVRTRAVGGVRALLAAGADPRRDNGRGSTPLALANATTGKRGSGTDEAKEAQREIIALLEQALRKP